MKNKCFLEVVNISKSFGNIRALKNINLKINNGEILALLGGNGAGKSTLIKIISGVLNSDKGKILINNKEEKINNPKIAHKFGIETVFQDLALIPNLNIVDNFFIGRELTHKKLSFIKVINKRKMLKETKRTIKKLGVNIHNLNIPVNKLSGGQQQIIAIARALYWKANLIILDEPTEAIGIKEQKIIKELIKKLTKKGIAIIYITHNIDDAISISDKIAVLYQGNLIKQYETKKITKKEIANDIILGK